MGDKVIRGFLAEKIAMRKLEKQLQVKFAVGRSSRTIVVAHRSNGQPVNHEFDLLSENGQIVNNGKLLVEKNIQYSKLGQEQDWKKLLTPESSGTAITLKHDGPVTRIMISTTYFFKSKYAGQIVAWIYLPAIYHFVEVSKEFSKRSIFELHSGFYRVHIF